MIALPVCLFSFLASSCRYNLYLRQVAVVVTSVYWNLYLFAPEMILKPMPDDMLPTPDEIVPSSAGPPALQRIPLRIDLSLHAAPAVSLLLDFFLVERKYPRSQAVYGGVLACAIACVMYGSWVEHLAKFNGACKSASPTWNPCASNDRFAA